MGALFDRRATRAEIESEDESVVPFARPRTREALLGLG